MNSKSVLYKNFLTDVENIIDLSVSKTTNLGNVVALIKEYFDWFWVGFYKTEGDELILNVFQGPPACVRIEKGKGVCGVAWKENRSIIVDNVDLFEGHISCNPASKSEIVIPFRNKSNEIVYILDIDHNKMNAFKKEDEVNLKILNSILLKIL
tara:strand:+ start:73 stop:531 length:459 start_codon:yes stop_codon:yes gene_type:complete